MPARAMHPERPLLAVLFALPIGVLAGLIGVGGAEFRLPVLVGALGYTARQAVPLNLALARNGLARRFAGLKSWEGR